MGTTEYRVKKVKLYLEIPVTVRESIQRMDRNTEAGGMTAVVLRALHVYDLLLRAKGEGAKIILRTDDKEAELLLT